MEGEVDMFDEVDYEPDDSDHEDRRCRNASREHAPESREHADGVAGSSAGGDASSSGKLIITGIPSGVGKKVCSHFAGFAYQISY